MFRTGLVLCCLTFAMALGLDADRTLSVSKYETLCIGIGARPGDIYVTRSRCWEHNDMRRIETSTEDEEYRGAVISDNHGKKQYIISDVDP